MNRLSEVPIPVDTGDYRLLSRRAVDALNALPERNRMMKGLFAWIGFNQATLDYDREPRAAGSSKWRYWKLWNLALEGITGFSVTPLKVATYVGSRPRYRPSHSRPSCWPRRSFSAIPRAASRR